MSIYILPLTACDHGFLSPAVITGKASYFDLGRRYVALHASRASDIGNLGYKWHNAIICRCVYKRVTGATMAILSENTDKIQSRPKPWQFQPGQVRQSCWPPRGSRNKSTLAIIPLITADLEKIEDMDRPTLIALIKRASAANWGLFVADDEMRRALMDKLRIFAFTSTKPRRYAGYENVPRPHDRQTGTSQAAGVVRGTGYAPSYPGHTISWDRTVSSTIILPLVEVFDV